MRLLNPKALLRNTPAGSQILGGAGIAASSAATRGHTYTSLLNLIGSRN